MSQVVDSVNGGDGSVCKNVTSNDGRGMMMNGTPSSSAADDMSPVDDVGSHHGPTIPDNVGSSITTTTTTTTVPLHHHQQQQHYLTTVFDPTKIKNILYREESNMARLYSPGLKLISTTTALFLKTIIDQAAATEGGGGQEGGAVVHNSNKEEEGPNDENDDVEGSGDGDVGCSIRSSNKTSTKHKNLTSSSSSKKRTPMLSSLSSKTDDNDKSNETSIRVISLDRLKAVIFSDPSLEFLRDGLNTIPPHKDNNIISFTTEYNIPSESTTSIPTTSSSLLSVGRRTKRKLSSNTTPTTTTTSNDSGSQVTTATTTINTHSQRRRQQQQHRRRGMIEKNSINSRRNGGAVQSSPPGGLRTMTNSSSCPCEGRNADPLLLEKAIVEAVAAPGTEGRISDEIIPDEDDYD